MANPILMQVTANEGPEAAVCMIDTAMSAADLLLNVLDFFREWNHIPATPFDLRATRSMTQEAFDALPQKLPSISTPGITFRAPQRSR